MKKVFLWLLAFLFVGSVFAYTPTANDVSNLNNLKFQLSWLIENNNINLRDFYNQLRILQEDYSKDARLNYMLGNLKDHLYHNFFAQKTHAKITSQSGKQEFLDQYLSGITLSYSDFFPFKIKEGRMFTTNEEDQGDAVCIIGYQTAINYFGNTEAIGQTIKVGSHKLTVIGVLEKEGENMLGGSGDELIFVPVLFLRNYVKLDSDQANPNILLKPKSQYTQEDAKNEIRILLRQYRKLPPKKEDDFSINTSTMITIGVQGLFRSLSIGGWIIGGFALLVGGFGIANIMFVSVKERTQQIGIQKALGAKRKFILLQFIIESVFLSIMGGIIGLILVLILSLFLQFLIKFSFPLTFANIVMGILIATIVGFLAGIIPALQASKLDPVEAMRRNAWYYIDYKRQICKI